MRREQPRNDDTLGLLLPRVARRRGGELLAHRAVLPQVRPRPGTCPGRGFEYRGSPGGEIQIFYLLGFMSLNRNSGASVRIFDKRRPVS